MITKKGRWTAAEVENLRGLILKKDLKTLSVEFDRPILSIRRKAIELGYNFNIKFLNKWSQNDIDYLILNYPNKSTKEIAMGMKRTIGAVEQKALRLKLKKSQQYLKRAGLIFETKVWSKDEIEYLSENYTRKSLTDIARDLNRSFSTVAQKAYRLNLKRFSRPIWSDENLDTLRKSFCHEDIDILAKKLQRSPYSLRQKAHRLGLRRRIGKQALLLNTSLK